MFSTHYSHERVYPRRPYWKGGTIYNGWDVPIEPDDLRDVILHFTLGTAVILFWPLVRLWPTRMACGRLRPWCAVTKEDQAATCSSCLREEAATAIAVARMGC